MPRFESSSPVENAPGRRRHRRGLLLGAIAAPLLASGCIVEIRSKRFYLSLVVLTAGPLALVLVCYACFAWARRTQKEGGASFTALLVVTQVMVAPASVAIFRTFGCDADFEDSKSFLRADYSVSCRRSSSTRQLAVAYASVMLFVWPVGVPAFYAVLARKPASPLSETALYRKGY